MKITTLQANRLLQHLRGIRKVVINACHGGFSLSHEAVLMYHTLSGTRIYWRDHDALGHHHKLYYTDADDFENSAWYEHDIDRDDPALVKVVETLGSEKSGGLAAWLKVVEIPLEVDWVLQEYDGLEWIAEKHRTWQ